MNSKTSDSPFLAQELKRYSRQIFLPEIRYSGQYKLKTSSVLIIGLGGLGSPCSMYLAASGIGKLILADYDTVELSNLQRQIVHSTQNVGVKKTASALQTLTGINPHTEFETIDQTIDNKRMAQIIAQVDLVVDCSDNFDTRYTVNTLCKQQQKPLVSAAVIAFQGQLICFDFRKTDSACYACLFPLNNNASQPTENCSEVGVLSTAAGIMGILQANEVLKTLLELPNLHNRLLMLDTLTLNQRIITVKKDEQCTCQELGKES